MRLDQSPETNVASACLNFHLKYAWTNILVAESTYLLIFLGLVPTTSHLTFLCESFRTPSQAPLVSLRRCPSCMIPSVQDKRTDLTSHLVAAADCWGNLLHYYIRIAVIQFFILASRSNAMKLHPQIEEFGEQLCSFWVVNNSYIRVCLHKMSLCLFVGVVSTFT